ncbi:MAG: membrane protein insertase YidC [Deltaproteobacteria bacterium]|nr:membrane protein insertase YidC [Deltaproteobacteria bacterium]
MQQRNTFTAIVICLGILIAWQTIMPRVFPEWFPPPPDATETASPDGGSAATKRDAGTPDGGAAVIAASPESGAPAGEAGEPGEGPEAGAAPEATAKVPAERPEEKVVLENEKIRATFTSKGAAVSSWVLLADRFEHDGPVEGGAEGETKKTRVDLVEVDEKEALPFSTTFAELEWEAGASYEIVKKTESSVTFRATSAGATVEKTFSLDPEKPYQLGLALTVAGDQALSPRVHLARRPPEEKKAGGFFGRMLNPLPDEIRPSCAYGEEVERRTYDEDELSFAQTGELRWVGIDSRYFLTTVFPGEPDPGAGCKLEIPEERRLRASLELPPVQPGSQKNIEGYLGPKFKTQLHSYGHDLERSIDFGWFGLLSIFLLYVMNFFQDLVGNWGVSIILLTVTVKIVLLPLTNWSMKSMEKMRAISPKMKELKDKYGKDQQRFQQEMMKMYREEGVSPFGGCLPMMLQMPIWIALYRTIYNTAELYQASFIAGWLDDLSAPEAGVIKFLPIAMGITMFLMQKMQPTPNTGDDTQARMQKTMIYMMPPFFTLIMYGLPSGLTLYIFVNNVLSIAQQYWIRRRLAAETGETKA